MCTIIENGRWLLAVNKDSVVDLVELDGPGRYTSCDPCMELAGDGFWSRLEECEFALQISSSGEVSSVTVEGDRGERSELVVDVRPNPDLTVASVVGRIVEYLQGLTSETKSAQSSLEKVKCESDQMTSERDEILARVCAILDDRNTWLEKLAHKNSDEA